MLPFYILTCFLFFLTGQGLGPAGCSVKWVESGWALQVSPGGLLSCQREEKMELSSNRGWEGTRAWLQSLDQTCEREALGNHWRIVLHAMASSQVSSVGTSGLTQTQGL